MRPKETEEDDFELFNHEDQTDETQALIFEGMNLVYIKAIDLDEARATGVTIPPDVKLARGVKLYALNTANGATLGITDNWASAYSAALENDLVPLSVH